MENNRKYAIVIFSLLAISAVCVAMVVSPGGNSLEQNLLWRVQALEAENAQMEQQIAALQGNMTNVKTSLANMQTSLSSLQNSFSTHQEQNSARFNSIEDDIDDLWDAFWDLADYVGW